MKCIILARVSTGAQDITEQENNLFNFAIRDGYTSDNIISISDKESAIKLDELERNGLNQLKEYITTDNTIKCVFVWELSRIARSPQILYSIRDFLIDHKVQLKVYDPSLTLFNSDFTINENSSLIFGLYASMAEAEMRQKKLRFKRGKDRNKKIGKFNGGIIKFGYAVDNDGFIIINEKEAEIVRLVYSIYNSGKSIVQTHKEITERGYSLIYTTVREILQFKGYSGSAIINNSEKKFPQIISNIEYQKRDKIANGNNKNINKSKNNIYFCRGLIKCDNCNSTYLAVISNVQYSCVTKYRNKHLSNIITECNSPSININLMDSIAWHYAKNEELVKLILNKENNTKEYKNKIQLNKEKIEATIGRINKLTDKKERNNDLFIDGNIDKKKYNNNIAAINEDLSLINSEVEKWNYEIKEYEKQIKGLQNSNENEITIDFVKQNIITLNSIKNQQLMYDIVHKNIKKITIEEIEKNKTKIITIHGMDDIIVVYKINIRTKILERNCNNNIDDYPNKNPKWENFDYQFLDRFSYSK